MMGYFYGLNPYWCGPNLDNWSDKTGFGLLPVFWFNHTLVIRRSPGCPCRSSSGSPLLPPGTRCAESTTRWLREE
jgi:hypothetical protein